MRVRKSLIGTTGLVFLVATALPATAAAQDNGNTEATFTIESGGISLSVPSSVDLGTKSAGASEVLASLGRVAVTDLRGGTAGWTTTVQSTDFTSGPGSTTVPASAVSYNAGTVSVVSGVAEAAGGPVSDLSTSQAVVTATGVSGNNVTEWNPTVTVALPPNALAATYTATITTSVS